jgi:anti-anti-sigma factor
MLHSCTGMNNCVFHDAETGESRPVFSAPRRGRPTAQVPAHLLSVSQSWQPDRSLTLTARGRLDINTVLSFRDSVFTALGERPSQLILDLSPLQQVEAAGVATLVTFSRVAQLMGIPWEIQSSPELNVLFQETGLDRLMSAPPATAHEIAQRLLLS